MSKSQLKRSKVLKQFINSCFKCKSAWIARAVECGKFAEAHPTVGSTMLIYKEFSDLFRPYFYHYCSIKLPTLFFG